MSLIQTLKIYKSLTPDQKQFVQAGEIEMQKSIPQWIKFFDPLTTFDENCDAARTKLWVIFGVSCMALFVSIFVVQFVRDGILIASFYGFMVVWMICLIVFLRILHKNDINDNIRNLVFPLLHVLSMEVGNKKGVKLRVNFNKKMKKDEISEVNDESTLFKKFKEVFYEYEVLEVNCTFLDKTKLNWLVFDRIRERTRTNPRGKTKTKTKLKRKIFTQLTFNTQLYSLATPADKIPETFGKIKQSDHKITFKNVLRQVADGKTAVIDQGELLNVVEGSYQFLTCKEGVTL